METNKERKKNPVGKLSLLRLYIFFANQIIKKYKTNNLIYITGFNIFKDNTNVKLKESYNLLIYVSLTSKRKLTDV